MKTLIALAAIAALPSVANAADFTYKTACIWNATGETVQGQMEWDDLDPAPFTLQPVGYFAYSWAQPTGAVKFPPLKLWTQDAPGVALNTSADKAIVLQPQDTGLIQDCTKLRRLKIHYRIEEVYDANGTVTGFKINGPISNP